MKLFEKGVSLAELLAVIVIMGIVSAIAVPLVGKLIDDAKKDAVVGDAMTIASSSQVYCMVNQETKFCNGDTLILDGNSNNMNVVAPGYNEYISKTFVGYSQARVKIETEGYYQVDLTEGKFKLSGNPLAKKGESGINGYSIIKAG